MIVGERQVAIVGVGQSAVGRRLGRTEMDLTLEACLSAVQDAGMDVADIDGLATFPGAMSISPGFSGPGTADVHDALRLRLNWCSAGLEGSGPFTPIVNACMAIAGGLAHHVLVYRTLTESTATSSAKKSSAKKSGGGKSQSRSRSAEVGGFYQWLTPFHAYSPVNYLALYAQAYMHRYGLRREQLGAIAINAHRNGADNPAAVLQQAITLDQYLDSRMISTPYCLYDCDIPCDGATALVLSHIDEMPNSGGQPIHIEAVGAAQHGRPSWDQWDDLTTMAMFDAAASMWERTDFTPADVDLVQLYDGFSFLALLWLEALGFCARGEAGAFVEDGTRIARDGTLPLNTDGGQLAAGRLHGFGRLFEACVQLRGDGGARQIPGRARVAVATAGGGPIGSALLLRAG